jgi:hypothetical protein
MSKNEDGGPAYPCERMAIGSLGQSYPVQEQGMSLRDWFAGQAMAGMLAGYHHSEREFWPDSNHVAVSAYDYADEMLAARKAGGQ